MENLLALMKLISRQVLAVVAAIGAALYFQERLHLFLPVIAGCLLGMACWFVAGYRIFKSSRLGLEAARRNMQFGWGIRLLLILVTLVAAARISTEVFWSVTAGFFLMFVLVMANVIAYAYKMNADNKK